MGRSDEHYQNVALIALRQQKLDVMMRGYMYVRYSRFTADEQIELLQNVGPLIPWKISSNGNLCSPPARMFKENYYEKTLSSRQAP